MLAETDIFKDLAPVPEVEAGSLEAMRPFMADHQPFVVRGLVRDWPLVNAGLESGKSARDYLLSKSREKPFVVSVGTAASDGRIFYHDDMSMNIRMAKSSLAEVFERIDTCEGDAAQPILYMSSVNTKLFFDGLHEENHIDFGNRDVIESIWIGTRTRIAAHNDFPDNIACVAVGQRRFTVFPPSEFRNLYIGPIDNTPAGRAVSMVDFRNPDFKRHPNFRKALSRASTVTLNPGDAIYIPSMWWHHVEGLSPFNVLVNYWWRETPRFLGAPQNALNHAIMAIRDLPEHERALWRDMFDYYVFENGPDVTDHIPEDGRGVLSPMTPERAARLRGFLLKMLTNE